MSSKLQLLARVGYTTKGSTYLIIAGMALAAAMGMGGDTTGSSGAIAAVDATWGGWMLLPFIAAGLLAYTAWKGTVLVFNPEGSGAGTRLYSAFSMVIHAGLVIGTVTRVIGLSHSGDEDGAEDKASTAMSFAGGELVVGITGLVLIGVGLRQAYRAWKGDFTEDLDLSSMSGVHRRLLTRIGAFGLLARGIVFVTIGGFLTVAGWQSDGREAGGQGAALAWLQGLPYGDWVLGVVAAGIGFYGALQVVKGRYRVVAAG